ncbi:hypothetical protein [Promicromonospora sp. NPDC023987]|uniref:hypothetical protein n=1 Tax=Promicromonospora sp. NPDC023987 TaxID=3155360 RepID=UPI0033C1817E
MRKMTVLGASALLVAGLMTTPAAAFAASPVASTSGDVEKVCPEEGKQPGENQLAITVTAPEGMVIVGYCVKAGSANQGDGAIDVDVDPPETTVEITHPSGKEISHYTVFYAPAPTPEPTEPGAEPTEPGAEPTEPGADITPEPTEPGAEPTEPAPDATEPAGESAAPADGDDATPSPSASAEGSEVLAATGASTVIGFTLIALALVGGGVTLIVLRRKGVLGS